MDVQVPSDDNSVFNPSTSPPLTGTLEVSEPRGMNRLVTQLLGLPSGIHFRKFKLLWNLETDLQWVTKLAEACSDTLEHIDLESQVDGMSRHPDPIPAAG